MCTCAFRAQGDTDQAPGRRPQDRQQVVPGPSFSFVLRAPIPSCPREAPVLCPWVSPFTFLCLSFLLQERGAVQSSSSRFRMGSGPGHAWHVGPFRTHTCVRVPAAGCLSPGALGSSRANQVPSRTCRIRLRSQHVPSAAPGCPHCGCLEHCLTRTAAGGSQRS